MSETQNYKFKKIEETDKVLKSINDINSNMDSIDSVLTNMDNDINTMNGNINTINSDIGNINGNIGNINNEINGINNAIDGIDNAMSDLESQITAASIISIVDTLPTTGVANKIYFVPKTGGQGNDLFDEYMWINNKWEWITTRQIDTDLTNYYNKTEVNNLLTSKVNTTDFNSYKTEVSTGLNSKTNTTDFDAYKTEVTTGLGGKADAVHTQSASTITAGLFPGNVVGQNLAVTLNGMRNIKAGTDDLTAGTSSLATGNIYFVYE